MLDTIKKTIEDFLGISRESPPTPEIEKNTIQDDIENAKKCLDELKTMSAELVNIKQLVLNIVTYSEELLNNTISSDNLHLLNRYLPIVVKIAREHVKYHSEFSNDLVSFWNLIKSKDIILRFSNILYDKCKRIKEHRESDFSAELAALDGVFKIKGY